jgi:DNA-binding transcriptional LysR family regulator
MNTPDWNDLRYFLAVTVAGTLSGAARALGVEHSTVARRIDALEHTLGIRLFDRFARGWSLTEAGQALQPQAQQVEQDILALLRQATATITSAGKVRVSGPPALIAQLIAPRLAAANAQLAGIDLELAAEPAMVDLERRDADIALRFQRPTAPDLAVRAVATIGYQLCATAAYLQAHAAPAWQFLGYDDSLAGAPQQQWLETLAGKRRFALRSNDLATLHAAACGGSGVALLPDYLAHGGTGLVALAQPACPVQRTLWLVVHDDVRKAARVRIVADLLAEILAS